LANSLPVALAIDFPREVLPTPGGPIKHKIVPVAFCERFFNAKNSKILSLNFYNP
jgi:hypothetical protein